MSWLWIMALPLVLLFGGYIAIRGGEVVAADPAEPDESPPTTDDEQEADAVASTETTEPIEPVGPMPDWDPLLEELRGDLPADFLRRWITIESGGNPCSVGSVVQLQRDGYAREAGLGQVYFERRDQVVFGATLSQLRGACSATTQDRIRPLTEEEKRAQVGSLCAMASSYYAKARALLVQVGNVVWTDDEVLALTKLYHALPALYRFLPGACADGQGDSWMAFRAWTCGRTAAQANVINTNIAQYQPFDRLFRNAGKTAGIEDAA